MIKKGYHVGFEGMGYGDDTIVMAESIESAIITFKIEFPKRRVTKVEEIQGGIVVLADKNRNVLDTEDLIYDDDSRTWTSKKPKKPSSPSTNESGPKSLTDTTTSKNSTNIGADSSLPSATSSEQET